MGEEISTFLYKIVPTRPDFATFWTEAEEKAMKEHFAYLKGLLEEGRLVLAGPCIDASFGIVIFDAESLELAREVALADPAIVAGVMSFEVHEFRVSLMKGKG